MKIAHISDLHLSLKYKPWSYNALLKLLHTITESEVDHLIITGDLTDNAEEHDFIFLRKVLKSFNLLNAQKTSIVIGNHDIFGGPQTTQDLLSFPSKCSSVDYATKVQKFAQYFFELFEDAYYPIEGKFFPFAKLIDSLVLVGMNTIDEYSRLKNPFASNGYVSVEQRYGLEEILKKFSEHKKIIMSHHHFYKNRIPAKSSESSLWNRIENYTMKLRGKKKLLQLFIENNVELILHGHSHDMLEYCRKGIRVLNAGGTFETHEENTINYFQIEILDSGIDVSQQTIPIELLLPQFDYSNQLIESLVM